MCSFLAKGMTKNVVAKMSHKSHNEYNNNGIRHSMNRIQGNDHRIGTHQINKLSLSYFDDKIYI